MKYFYIIIFGLLKLFYMNANNNSMLFILKPLNKIVNLLTNTSSILLPDSGYYNNTLNIIINRSCSGFNFLLIFFVMISFRLFKYFKTTYQKIIAIPILLICSYIVTIFVNSSRILLSLKTSLILNSQNITLPWFHLIQGVFVYLFFLILIYTIIDKTANRRMEIYE